MEEKYTLNDFIEYQKENKFNALDFQTEDFQLKFQLWYLNKNRNNKTYRWVRTSDRQPKKEQYYIVLRKGSNPDTIYNATTAVHFWYADTKEWSSEIEYWLEEIISNQKFP
jgi:dsRNA-specific ribonuclease